MDYTKDGKVDFIPYIKSISGELANSFNKKYYTFRDMLFPKPPTTPPIIWDNYTPNNSWKWPKLDYKELEIA